MKSYTSIITLSLALLILVGYNFISAQSWTAPTGTPPANNAAAPVNIGTTAQDKNGTFTANKLGVISSYPVLEMIDATAGQKDWRAAVESDGNSFVIRADRNQTLVDGAISWTDNGNNQLVLANGETNADDYAQFSNQVRATEYCDRSGRNCFDSAEVGESELPGEDEVGSIILAVINPSAPMSDTYDQNVTDGSVLKYGDTILGRHLCPAGILMADTNDNDKISMIQSAGNGTSATTCAVTLTGVWRTLGYSYHRSTTLSSNNNRTAATLFQKISDTIPAATYTWTISSWGYCSVYAYCDGRAGTQTRSVKCRNNNTGATVSDSYCPSPKPAVSQTCYAPVGGGCSR